jgi:hypothetical protein
MLSIPKRVLLALVVVLSLVSALLSWAIQDPAREQVRAAFFGYLGDLRQGQGASAARRILPEDLFHLKQGALEKAGGEPEFRSRLQDFLGVRDAAELTAVPKERFFEFLMLRTQEQHPHVKDVLSEGKVEGTGVNRTGNEAEMSASFALSVPEGRRSFSMRLHFTKVDDVWFLRL